MYIDYQNIKTNYIFAWLLRSISQVINDKDRDSRLRLTINTSTKVSNQASDLASVKQFVCDCDSLEMCDDNCCDIGVLSNDIRKLLRPKSL